MGNRKVVFPKNCYVLMLLDLLKRIVEQRARLTQEHLLDEPSRLNRDGLIDIVEPH